MGKNQVSDIVKKLTPPISHLKLFYWGSFITFLGIIMYQLSGYLFFIWAPTLLIASIRELKSKEPSGMNWFYFSLTAMIVLLLTLTIL